MTDPKNPCDPQSKKTSQAPAPMTYLTGGGVDTSPGRSQITPKGMEPFLDFIERNEDARQQLYDGDVTAFKRSRDGRTWPIKKDEWGNDKFWDRARRTGCVRDGVVAESPLFIEKGAEQPDTTTATANE